MVIIVLLKRCGIKLIANPLRNITIKAAKSCPSILVQGFNDLESSARPIIKRIRSAIIRPKMFCSKLLNNVKPSSNDIIIPDRIPNPPRTGIGVRCIFNGSSAG